MRSSRQEAGTWLDAFARLHPWMPPSLSPQLGGLAGPGTKPTAGGRGAALKLLRLLEGRRHRAEQELLRLGEKGLRCLPALIRATPLQYKYHGFNKPRVIRWLQVTAITWCQHKQRIKSTIIVVLAVRRTWQWRIRVSQRGVTGRGMESLSFNWLMLFHHLSWCRTFAVINTNEDVCWGTRWEALHPLQFSSFIAASV